MRRSVAVALLWFALLLHAAPAWCRVYYGRPTRMDDATFAQLLDHVRARSGTDDKIVELRAATRTTNFVFTAAQATALVDTVDFWQDRAELLRVVRVLVEDRGAVRSYFDPAPAEVRELVVRILVGAPN